MPKRKDPKVGTGKKPKGSGRRLYSDARATVAKVKKINKPYARKIQILTVLEQRARFANKPQQSKLAKAAKKTLKSRHNKKKT